MISAITQLVNPTESIFSFVVPLSTTYGRRENRRENFNPLFNSFNAFSICDLRHRQLNPEKGKDITKLLTLKSFVIHLKRLLDGCNIQT